MDGMQVRQLAATEPRSEASARLAEWSEKVLALHRQQAEHEQAVRAAGLELQAARADRDQIEVAATLGEAEAPPAERKKAEARVERAATALQGTGDRRRILAEAQRRAEADVLAHLQQHDAELVAEHNARLSECVERLRSHLAEAVSELDVLRGLVAAGDNHLRLAGRGLERVADERVMLLEPQLRAVAASAADERIAPLVPLPRSEEELAEQVAAELSV
jgi:hypothetical protein